MGSCCGQDQTGRPPLAALKGPGFQPGLLATLCKRREGTSERRKHLAGWGPDPLAGQAAGPRLCLGELHCSQLSTETKLGLPAVLSPRGEPEPGWRRHSE